MDAVQGNFSPSMAAFNEFQCGQTFDQFLSVSPENGYHKGPPIEGA